MGSKENGWRHLAQKPVVRPGRPSVERPTAAPQLEQNRLFSGTTGFFITASAASMAGIGGMVVRPGSQPGRAHPLAA